MDLEMVHLPTEVTRRRLVARYSSEADLRPAKDKCKEPFAALIASLISNVRGSSKACVCDFAGSRADVQTGGGAKGPKG
jgi:hypothetical protein